MLEAVVPLVLKGALGLLVIWTAFYVMKLIFQKLNKVMKLF